MLFPDGPIDFGYARRRLHDMFAPPVIISDPPKGVRFEKDVPVKMRDGTILRVNVFRPETEGRYPVIMSAHPYGKDAFPKRTRSGYRPPLQYHLMRQPAAVRFSAWTTWEAPDPAFWVPRGYVVINCDLRGFGSSEGQGNLLTEAEGLDYHDLIEWAAIQPFSTGKIGLCGVSYLAISQWRVAATQPPHLAAICPWEGFTDAYRDLVYPGGIREDGFFVMWSKSVKRSGRYPVELRKEQLARPLRDAFWQSLAPDLSAITVPALICGSFSDHNLHSGGSFEGFRRISSREKWLYTHGTGKWVAFYSEEGLAFQARFFDCFLKGEENGMRSVPPVRLEVRASGSQVHSVRSETSWPPAQTDHVALHLRRDGTMGREPEANEGLLSYSAKHGSLRFRYRTARATEIVGPLKLSLYASVEGATDACLFAGLRKLDSQGQEVHFEGSYGMGQDVASHGFLRLSHRELDPEASTNIRPVHRHLRAQPLSAGEVVALEMELLPTAIWLAEGESIELVVQGHWLHPTNPIFGGAAAYESIPQGTVTIHLGPDHPATLLVPMLGGSATQ